MATLKLTLDQRRLYKDGRHPLILRLTVNGKSTSIDLGVKLSKKFWDPTKLKVKKGHPNAISINHFLSTKVLDYEERLREVQLTSEQLSLADTAKRIRRENRIEKFKGFSDETINDLVIRNRYGNAQFYRTASNKLIEFGGKALLLKQIDYSFISKFDVYLSKQGIGVNSRSAYMRGIRAILNSAIKQGIYDSSLYPFKEFRIKVEETPSRAISLTALKELYNFNNLSIEQKQAKDIFFLIFSLIGISFMDLALLKRENIVNNRIVYKRRKTGKIYSIKLSPMAILILNKIGASDTEYLVPLFDLEGVQESKLRHQVNLALRHTNRYLKQLGKLLDLPITLTTYVARYSWSNIAKSEGFSKDIIAEALGHSYGNRVTGIYLDGYTNEVIDKVNIHILKKLEKNKNIF